MKFYLFLGMTFFLCTTYCSTDIQVPENYAQYKKLEYNRSSNLSAWQKVFEKSDTNTRKDILFSIAKTKNDSLVPFLKEQLEIEKNEALIDPAVFALGQLKTVKAEKLLLQYYDSAPSIKIKKAILAAFEQCGSDLCTAILVQAVSEDSLRRTALQTAAILARKKINMDQISTIVRDSSWAFSSLKENAYFIYNSSQTPDLNIILLNLINTEGLTQKYYLKSLLRILSNNPDSTLIKVDSTYQQTLSYPLRKILNKNEFWHNTYYALQCFSYFADSTDKILITKLSEMKNPHIRIEALKVYAHIFKDASTGFLLNQYKSETNDAIKGKIVFYIAENQPDAAYRMIMQNLDKGTISFKMDLLSALSLIDNKLAINSIRSYLYVSEKRLINHAFDILNKKNEIHFSDIEGLMQTEIYSVLYNILDWQIQHKKYVNTNLLFNAFTRFKSAENSETQDLIADILIGKKSKIPLTNIDELLANAANKSVYEKLINAFPGTNTDKPIWSNNNYPGYLSVDSLLTLPRKNIIVEISTNKGEIEVELFPTIAPLTVKNFLSLAEKKFYNNLTFHRVIADFVVQGGDPSGDGWGGAGYSIQSEDMLPFERGSIGIATSGFDTGSCQFFICQSEQPHLRGNYTAFGKVTTGMDVVDQITVDDVLLSVSRIQ